MKREFPIKENGKIKKYKCRICKKNLSNYSSARYHAKKVKCINYDNAWW